MNAIRYQRADEPNSNVKLALIRTDGGTQSRAGINDSVVDEYAAAIGEGANFPKMVIFYDGGEHWLADGFHRHRAYLKAGIAVVEADVRQGTRRDAVLFSVGANASHGLRRTNEDKRRAVSTLLADAEWSAWSDREIARRAGVHHDLVARLRDELSGGNRQIEGTRTVERNGTTYTMDTSAIGSGNTEAEDRLKTQPVPAPQNGGMAREDEITAEDLANDPGFQKAVEALNSAKAFYDEAIAAPSGEPLTPEREANLRRVLGTPEQRSMLRSVLNMAKAVADLPKPDEMVSAVPPALNHTIDVLSLLAAADWFEQFARAWERSSGVTA